MSASTLDDGYVTGTLARASRPGATAAAPTLDTTVLLRFLPAVVLTLLDAALTYTWLELGLAAEANPWLAGLVESSGPGAAMAVRVAVGVTLVGLLGLLARDHASARKGLVVVTAALALVCGWHVVGSATVALA